MSEIECLLSSCFCCFNFCECIDSSNKSHTSSYQSLKEEKDNNQINIVFFYDETDERIDKNINQIIFYEEYLQGYYTLNNTDLKNRNNKNILVIYNKQNTNTPNITNIVNIINNIYTNKGLIINNQKWLPKQIWIFNS